MLDMIERMARVLTMNINNSIIIPFEWWWVMRKGIKKLNTPNSLLIGLSGYFNTGPLSKIVVRVYTYKTTMLQNMLYGGVT